MTDEYFYEPAVGHGLTHNPFNAIVGPRPIGWVASQGKDGSCNLAPYSFFNAFCYTPPIIGFSSNGRKDTLRNVTETGEFTWNLVTRAQAEAMNASSGEVEYGADEFALAGLAKTPSRLVAPPRVGDCPVGFECKVTAIHRLHDHAGTAADAWLVLGEVIGVHIDRALLKDGKFDTFNADIVLRAGGPSAYLHVTPEARFDMHRPGS